MELANISGLIKNCPNWHLLTRVNELNNAIALLGSKDKSENEIKCGAAMAEDLIFSALKSWHGGGEATENNRFDLWCLLPYLYCRADKANLEKEVLVILLALHGERRRKPGTMNYNLIKFLEGWADFLIAEVHTCRTNG